MENPKAATVAGPSSHSSILASKAVMRWAVASSLVLKLSMFVKTDRLILQAILKRIIQLTFKHKLKEVAEGAARLFAENLKPHFEKYMAGPAEPVVNRIRNQYLVELVLKLPKDAKLIQFCKESILAREAHLHNHSSYKGVVVLADVDAV